MEVIQVIGQTQAVHHYQIEVNEVTFREEHQERTGMQIKQDAIAAGVKIKTTYLLEQETKDGNIRIGDDQVVQMRSGLEFIAHPGGSDS